MHDQDALIAVLERCGAVHKPRDFCIEAVHAIRDIVAYDEARVYFLSSDAAVYDEYLVDVSKATVQDYHRHYAHVDDDAYSASRFAREYTARMRGNERNRYIPVVVDWALEPHDTTFFQEHLAPQNLRWCIGFGFFDLADRVRVIFTLDRYATSEAPTHAELVRLRTANRLLDGMYRNFYAPAPPDTANLLDLTFSDSPLTGRELDVARLLLAGYSAKAIAEELDITRATVYKHMQNMREKLGVKGHTALLARLNDLSG